MAHVHVSANEPKSAMLLNLVYKDRPKKRRKRIQNARPGWMDRKSFCPSLLKWFASQVSKVSQRPLTNQYWCISYIRFTKTRRKRRSRPAASLIGELTTSWMGCFVGSAVASSSVSWLVTLSAARRLRLVGCAWLVEVGWLRSVGRLVGLCLVG